MNEHNNNQTEHKERGKQPENSKQEFKPSQKPEGTSKGNGPSKNTIAVLTYPIFFLPWLTSMKNDDFVKYHFRQALGLFLTAVILQSFLALLSGPFFYYFLQPLRIGILVFLGYGMYNAYKGEKKPLWVIGEYADRAFKNL